MHTLTALKRYITDHGYSPTLSEFAQILKVGSVQTVSDRLTALKKKGFIRKSPHAWRNIELANTPLGSNKLIHIPVVGSVGADQMNVFAEYQYDQFLQVKESLLKGHREVIAIHVIGSSMRDANIYDGDYVFVENNEGYLPTNGDIVAVVVGDKAVVKKYYRGNKYVELRPCSTDPQYSPIIIDSADSDDLKIVGRVINTLHFADKPSDDYQFIYDPE
jgi:repressor LexA